MANNWAIVVGINQYRFLQPLKYAKRDAEMMQSFLHQEAKFDRIFLFTDDSPPISGKSTEPFRANLLRVLRQIFDKPFMKDGDNFWFFFSGHGIPHNGQDYLMPLDGDPEDVENTGISTNAIANYLRSCGADNAVMILDACRSGGKKSGEGIGRQTEAEARQTGVISLFSCSPEQYSYEVEAIEQGAFTYALLEGLGIRGRCATVERLNQYLEHRVPELVTQYLGRVRQVPYTIAEPLNRSHLILMPQHASLADIATLKNDAYRAERNQDWDLAQRLWIRVNAAASGQDMEAIEAIQNLGIQRHTRTAPPQSEPPQTAESSRASSNPTTPPKKDTAQRSASTTPTNSPSTASSSSVPVPKSQSSSKPFSVAVTESPSTSGSRSLTRRQVLKWTIPSGVGVVGLIVASQLTKVDYSPLEELLRAMKWKEADQKTSDLIESVINREQIKSLSDDNIKNFPCNDLSKIDQLWADNSGGRFGYRVQREIYVQRCGGKLNGQYDEKAWQCFGDQVGWRVNNRWITSKKEWLAHSPVTFDTDTKGTYPTLYFDCTCCEASEEFANSCRWKHWRYFFLVAETCKL
jgi:uncharacterized caspase-like protein